MTGSSPAPAVSMGESAVEPAAGEVAARLLAWFDLHGRHDLPWQHPRSAYRVWLAEVMLQQTQVTTVVPYFVRFLQRFPDIASLAAAPLEDVLQRWAGLGYYARARNLHRTAQILLAEHRGEMPRQFAVVHALPGIGRSTAGAILAQAYGQRHAILDGNVKRVLSRYHAVGGWPGETAVTARLWAFAETHTPQERLADYTQAIMDLGATLCTRSKPDCARCPLASDCIAHRQGKQADFPGRKRRRERPHRQAQMLLLRRPDGAVLLLRRPPVGIWGGLWCLPQLDAAEKPVDYCQTILGVQAQVDAELAPLEHGFTHFDLTIQPLLLGFSGTPVMTEPRDILWYKPGDTLPGVPAPVRTLLETLRHIAT